MGEIVSIWVKRAHGGPMDAVAEAELVVGRGVRGSADQGGKRQLTIIDEGAWSAAEQDLGVLIDPTSRRANVMLRGLDLESSRGKLQCPEAPMAGRRVRRNRRRRSHPSG